ncbi:type IV pilus modification PilV family protein [Shewanella phaeophyticola]|uniref:Type II secretion system GspH family protein n=1 Tax=Shewanella phaeophyticola TaxID=2978345 RepID=A0ABT2P5P4_9GAMM|nr:prepilin-type N-terminal cleavage/methylation domain-containing protein [Shewanella sp. KJ10-1]MCT8987992.1 type II secretion system GspH family protein [Shewanella sp. KJ10-1]
MRNKLQCQPTRRIKGFTLIELVIGMMVIAVAIVMLTSMLFPQADKASATLQRVRSAELAHSVMNEIWGKRYDQNTNANGGVPSCNASAGLTCSTSMGNDGESRDAFNDVDDYHGLNETSNMLDSSQTYAQAYPGFKLAVTVSYLDTTQAEKLITVDVTTPSSEVITYQTVRSNY